MLLKRLLDFCLPRFVTEEVVFEELFYLGELESWSPACSLDEIKARRTLRENWHGTELQIFGDVVRMSSCW
ncbi:Uncharacterised protein [Budvicia aquatica]|uniref:Uncharacterized protein n=1 Tax=Budvicia aquatica TaxID=82979 RepID=A0A484ZPF4_9GAMM|nr:Uncharacterised protein [Budvicia aquatica]